MTEFIVIDNTCTIPTTPCTYTHDLYCVDHGCAEWAMCGSGRCPHCVAYVSMCTMVSLLLEHDHPAVVACSTYMWGGSGVGIIEPSINKGGIA